MSRRDPRWDLDKLRGDEGEQLVRKMRSAVIAGTCEVKTDDRALSTGNVYVEYECKTATGWQPSGIQTTKASAWAFVCGRTVVWMPTWVLRNVARDYEREQRAKSPPKTALKEQPRGSHPTKGVVIPLPELVTRSLIPFKPEQEREAA